MKRYIKQLKKQVLAILLVAMVAPVFMPTQHTYGTVANINIHSNRETIPVQHNLPDDKLQRLHDFFRHFMHSFSVIPTLGDYDVNSPEGAYTALDFVLSNSVFLHGRLGELGLPYYGFVEYMGGSPVENWSQSVRFEFVSTRHVDSILLRYFNITNFRHDSERVTPVFGFQYSNGRYYYEAFAQGCGTDAVQNIFAFYDNGNGTYSVRIQYLTWEMGDERWGNYDYATHVMYNIAVIQSFEDTFQMLYWRNRVERDSPIPVRQSTSATPPPITPAPPQNNAITVTINNTPVNFANQYPIIIDGRTLVPIRDVFEAINFNIQWNPQTYQATLTRDNQVVMLTIGSATFTTNDTPHQLDVPAQIIGGSTMLPLRAILESVGYDLGWEETTRTITITSSEY